MVLLMCKVKSVVKALEATKGINVEALPVIFEAMGGDFEVMEKKINTLEDKLDNSIKNNEQRFNDLDIKVMSIDSKLDLLISQEKCNSEVKTKRLNFISETIQKVIEKPYFWIVLIVYMVYKNGEKLDVLKGWLNWGVNS